jgi:hypothetical protein
VAVTRFGIFVELQNKCAGGGVVHVLGQRAQAILSDSVSPAICMNEDCDFTCEMEPDQDAGYCEECRTNSMHSALILAGLI